MHGVEAYAGSAVQLALLAEPPAVPADSAMAFVHVLNPYGMSWLRRTNENNVDLNRNFIFDGTPWSGAPAKYAALDPLLNPPSPPRADGFYVRAALALLTHGREAAVQAIAEGQYEFPRGLFFGGHALEEGPRLYTQWLRETLAETTYVFAIDFHTGLGRRGEDVVFPKLGTVNPIALARALDHRITDTTTRKATYTVRGGLDSALPYLLPRARVDFLLQEIGTYPLLRVLHALREENRWHFHGRGSVQHPAKSRAREALCPSALDWRRRAVALGAKLARAAAAFAWDGKRHGL